VMLTTRATTWAAWIAAVLMLTASSSMASAATGLLSPNSCQGKNALDGGFHRASLAVSGETCQGCAEVSSFDAAGLFVAPLNNPAQRRVLYHYTDEAGARGITGSGELRPSLRANNPRDVRYGEGQYLSDFAPGTKTPAQLSREFLGQPFQGRRFTHYVEIDVTDLNVVQGRNGVFVVPGNQPLDLTGRIVGSGPVPPVGR
jgi:hypothetical protein